MPSRAQAGERLHGYEIVRTVTAGENAVSYESIGPGGARVFLKQFLTPTRSVPWYREYLRYQDELHRRLALAPARGFACPRIEAFETTSAPRTYWQVFEWLDESAPLQPVTESWPQRLDLARLLLAAVAAFHEVGVVHGDLKPANVRVLGPAGVESRLKLVDTDSSLLVGRPVPWQGHRGHVGTEHYYSPEHLQRGAVPGPASDVFTCGLMLYALLGGGSPYGQLEREAYRQAVLAYRSPPPELRGPLPTAAGEAALVEALHRCLAPDPLLRPPVRQLELLL
jgi:eukaryotic-like serine/threonine-protein kinase